MGGIIGQLCFGTGPPDAALMADMLAAGAHLGGDGDSIWIGPHSALGVTHYVSTPEDRLHLPLLRDGDSVVLAADIRLDNRDELADKLGLSVKEKRRNPGGVNSSDAELVLAAYQHWGCDAFVRLVGCFALAIWDGRERELVCARDALGRRPLFLHRNENRLLCASSIRQLFCDRRLRRSVLNERYVAAYLAGRQLPETESFFAGIERLPSGTWVRIGQDGRSRRERYWRPESISLQTDRSLDDWAHDFRELFTRAVEARLRSNSASVGLHVSGGIDSTAVVSMVHHLTRGRGPTRELFAFQNVGDRPEADERRFMQLVLDHYPMCCEANRSSDYWAFKPHPKMATLSDEPFQPPYMARVLDEVSQARRLGSSLILSGDGGDEIGGSSWFLVDRLLRGRIRGLLGELRGRAAGKSQSAFTLLRLLMRATARHWIRHHHSNPPRWLSSSMRRELSKCPQRPRTFSNPAREDTFFRMSNWWIEPSVPAVVPLMSACRVELRQPFLDRRIFEWALSIPPALMGRDGCVKAPVRFALYDLFPEEIRKRPGKGDYLYYFDLGLRTRERPRIEEMLQTSRLAELGYIDRSELLYAYQRYAEGGSIDRGHLWNALTMENWLQSVE